MNQFSVFSYLHHYYYRFYVLPSRTTSYTVINESLLAHEVTLDSRKDRKKNKNEKQNESGMDVSMSFLAYRDLKIL